MKLKDSITRRKLLESTTHGMLLLPLMRLFQMDEAIGAETILPRAMFVHWPCGVYNDTWWPAGDSGAIPSLASMKVSSPLEAIKSDLILFKGVCQRGNSNHTKGPSQALAAWGKARSNEIQEFPLSGADADPYSLDQRLADRWGAKTTRPSIFLGAGTAADVTGTSISWNKAGTAVKPQSNPVAAFNDIFGGFSVAGIAGSTNQLALAQDKVLSGKKRIIDYLSGDLKKIKSILGPTEGAQYESHIGALDDIAQEIQKSIDASQPSTGGDGGSTTPVDGKPPRLSQCAPNDIKSRLPTSNNAWYDQSNQFGKVYSLNRQIILQAMACGITRVGVLAFGMGDTGSVYPTNVNENGDSSGGGSYHTMSHSRSEDFYAMQKHFMVQVVELVKGFQAVKVGDRTLWDEVLLLGATDIGDDPNGHDNANIACFLAGRLGGKLKGNRMISFPFTTRGWAIENNGCAYNKVLQTFASLVGENIDNIGSSAYGGIIKEV